MHEPPETPAEERYARNEQFQEAHFHDDEDDVPIDDIDRPLVRAPVKRRTVPKYAPRLYEDDE